MKKNLITLALIGLATLSTVSNAAYTIIVPLEVAAGGTGGGGTGGNGSLPAGSIAFVNDSAVEPEEPVDENANWDIVSYRLSTGCVSEGETSLSYFFTPVKSNTSGTTFPSDVTCGFQVLNDKKLVYYYAGSKYKSSFENVPGTIWYTAPASITVETENGASVCNKESGFFKDISGHYNVETGVSSVYFRLYYNCTSSIGASSQTLKIKF